MLKILRGIFFAAVLMASCCVATLASEDRSLGVLEKINKETALHWKKSGPGYSLINANLNLEEILRNTDASCAQQSYVFARKAMHNGYYARRLGLWASNGLNDIMVEVNVDGVWFLFAPSTGAYYPFGIADLINNPRLAALHKGEVVSGKGYLTESFFGSLSKIDILSSFNDIEHNFIKDASIVSGDKFYPHPNNLRAATDGMQDTYAAGVDGKFPYLIDFVWDKKISVYRISFDWYSISENSRDYEVYIDKGSGYELISAGRKFAYYARGDYVLSSTVGISKLRIRFNSAPGQNRILLREIGVY